MTTDLGEYEAYLSSDFNAAQLANSLFLETNNSHDSSLDLETSIKKLGFDLNDLNLKINENVKTNSKILIKEFDQIEKLKNETDLLKPSINQLNNSFERLNNEIIKPYNECINLQNALKKIHQTNKILRSLTFIVYLLNKIEEIDKSENSLSTKPFKILYNLSVLLNEFNNYSNKQSLNLIKLISDYIKFSVILTKRCENIIQFQIKNLLKFQVNDYLNNNNKIELKTENNEKILFNLLASSLLLNNSNFISLIELIYSTSIKHSINLILRNLNNTKFLPSYIKSLELPSNLIATLENFMKNNKWISSSISHISDITIWENIRNNNLIKIFNIDELNSISLIDKFWRDVALGVDSGVKETVNRGGPIVKNLKLIKDQLEIEIKNVVQNSYKGEENIKILKTEKLEIRMMLNSITNFEKRR